MRCYYGTSSRYVTVLEGIQNYVGDDVRVLYSDGCHLYQDRIEPLAWRQDRISEAVITAMESDVVVLCVGLDETLEGEEMDTGNQVGSGDKLDLMLPEVQRELIKKVLAVGKPTIVVLMAGSSIDLSYVDEHADAILQAWYPGAEGGTAIADLLFGEVSPSGKLPVTFYRDLEGMPEFTDYSMKNRTYRYLEKEPLYPFGYGLSYGRAVVTNAEVIGDSEAGKDMRLEVTIQNESSFTVSEVVQVYIKDEESPLAVKNHSLCAFKRVDLKPGEVKVIEIGVAQRAFTVVDEQGERRVESKRFTLYAGTSQPDGRSAALTGVRCSSVKYIQI